MCGVWRVRTILAESPGITGRWSRRCRRIREPPGAPHSTRSDAHGRMDTSRRRSGDVNPSISRKVNGCKHLLHPLNTMRRINSKYNGKQLAQKICAPVYKIFRSSHLFCIFPRNRWTVGRTIPFLALKSNANTLKEGPSGNREGPLLLRLPAAVGGRRKRPGKGGSEVKEDI